MNPFKPADEKGTRNYQKVIATASVPVAVLLGDLLDDYFLPWVYALIKGDLFRDLVKAVLPLVVDAGLFVFVFAALTAVLNAVFCLTRRSYYLKGLWLHIHDKATPRTGYAVVDQEFYKVFVSAENADPGALGDARRKTTWNYIGNRFDPTQNQYQVACYSAKRGNEGGKYGMHVFESVTFSQSGYPIELAGSFGDIIRPEDLRGGEGVFDRTGKIYFFRIGHGGIRLSRKEIKQILTNPQDLMLGKINGLAGSSYAKKLAEIIEKNRILEEYRLLTNLAPEMGISPAGLERVLARLLCTVVFADGNVDADELALLNDIFKTAWKKDEVARFYIGASDDALFQDAFAGVCTHQDFCERFEKLLVDSGCLMIRIDEKCHADEAQCFEKFRRALHI